jgi:hypothetical protein
VFARLRHDAFVGGNHEQAEVDSGSSDEHAAHKIFVAWNIDDTNGPGAVERQRSESEVDGDATALFLGKSVCVNARQRSNKRRFAVVNVPRGSDDHAADQRSCSQTAKARSGRSSLR